MNKNQVWNCVCIKDVCDSIIDCVNKTAPTVEHPTEFKMIRTTNVKKGWIDLSEVKYVTQEIFERWTRRAVPEKGDIILTREAPLGEVGMIRGSDKVFLGQRLVQYRANPNYLDNKFLLYAFQEHDLQSQIKALGSGATVEHMRVPDAEKVTLLLPPLTLQRKIVNILSAYDDLIENNTRRITILEETARTLYQEWFVKFRFPRYEQVEMVESEMGMIPEGWKLSSLGDLANEMRKGVNPEVIDPETPYFGLEHLPRRSIALSDWGIAREVQSTKLSFQRDEILFGKIRPYLHKVGVAPLNGVCSSDTIVISIKQEKYFGMVLCCVSSDNFVDHANKTSQGTQMPRANWDILSKYPLALPPKPLLDLFDEAIRGFVMAIHNYIFRNRNLRRTRDLLLPKLISGEIDVSSWANDEEKKQEGIVVSEVGRAREMEPAQLMDVVAMQQRMLWE